MGLFSKLFGEKTEEFESLKLKNLEIKDFSENDQYCKGKLKELFDHLTNLIGDNNAYYLFMEQKIANMNNDTQYLNKYFEDVDYIEALTFSSCYAKIYAVLAYSASDLDSRLEIIDSLKFIRDYVAYKTIKYYKEVEAEDVLWSANKNMLTYKKAVFDPKAYSFANCFIERLNCFIKQVDKNKINFNSFKNFNVEVMMLSIMNVFGDEY